MIDTDSIFKGKKWNERKAVNFGFSCENAYYFLSVPILEEPFYLEVVLREGGAVDYRVIEADSGEEYIPLKISGAEGPFLRAMRDACEEYLVKIAEECFDEEDPKNGQAGKILAHARNAYGVEPEFLWEKYPDYGVLRVSENGKWFAAIMKVKGESIAPNHEGDIVIVNLKDTPENIGKRLDGKMFLPAYHE